MEFSFRRWVSRLFAREAPEARPSVRLKRVDTLSLYRSVNIRAGATSCEAAKQLGGKRFLSEQAPRLPLPECTCETCNCSYVHHADRRTGRDRRRKLGETPVAGSFERRIARGRRGGDSGGFNDPSTTR